MQNIKALYLQRLRVFTFDVQNGVRHFELQQTILAIEILLARKPFELFFVNFIFNWKICDVITYAQTKRNLGMILRIFGKSAKC